MIFDKLAKTGSDFLGVKYPIICGAMTWISNYKLVKAVGDAGGFPVLAGGNMPGALFEEEIDKCIQGMNTPFGVNLITIAPNYKLHYKILQSKNVPIVIFAGSFPRKAEIQTMKASGKKTMSFASEKSIADQQIKFGIDALILEGSEAGGHIGNVSLIILLQQVLFNCDQVPIFVGGGLGSGRMMAHLLLMGAAGCQFGTRFVLAEECCAHARFKEAFIKAKSRQAVSTPQYDSKLPVVAVRALKNQATNEFGKLQLALLTKLETGKITRERAQFEVEKFWMGKLKDAVEDGDIEKGSVMAGQSVGLVDKIQPVKQIIQELVQDAENELTMVKKRFMTQ
jgi:enoyl-[acyl-carrier protein] reductase II